MCRREGRVGRITLNRPKALHALTTAMCREMTTALLAWRTDPEISLVLLDHSGERGFCAGGDIRMLAESGSSDGAAASEFFFTEYRLNHLLFSYDKPVAAVMDGTTMGGGVGISRPARYRVATERTVFAMPETAIGLFPDVGGGWYLSRMPDHAGLWAALTGARLKAADCLALDIATHYFEATKLEVLKARLLAQPDHAGAILDEMRADAGAAPVADVRRKIAALFAGDSVEAIFAALEADGGDWAQAQLALLKTRSPQALKISFRQLQLGAQLKSFAENMRMEYRLACRVVRSADFREGVRAVIVDKDNKPRWQPADLAGVTPAVLDEFFVPLKEEWTPLPGIS